MIGLSKPIGSEYSITKGNPSGKMGKWRILLLAYQCGPGMGSVSQIGWEWYSRLAKNISITLVTHVRNREAIQQADADLGDEDVVYVDTEWFAGPLYRLASRLFPQSQHAIFLLSSLDFFLYDWTAKKILQRRINAGESWNLIHAITPVTNAAPSCLHRLGLPFIWGPLNSGLGVPKGFSDITKQDSTWLYPIRNLARLIDGMNGCTRQSEVILTATRATVQSVPLRHRGKCRTMLENGVDLLRFTPQPWPGNPSRDHPLRILFVGRLVAFKALPLLLEALSQVKNEMAVEVRVIGEGPMDVPWKQRAVELGVAPQVHFCGNQSLDRVAKQFRDSHVLCLPSIRESGGAVLLEAMASARPVIAVAYGGPAELVDRDVGWPISPTGPEEVVRSLVQAIRDITLHPMKWRLRGEEGRRRAESLYCWNRKIETALELYDEILDSR